MKSVSNCSENNDSHMEWSGDSTSTSPSSSNLRDGKLRLGGVKLLVLCSIKSEAVVVVVQVAFLGGSEIVVDSLGEVGLKSLHEFSLLIEPMLLPPREFIIILKTVRTLVSL